MPQINRIRVNNVKYNFGTQFYDDFVMRFSGRNTIYDLANGGGKSVLMLLLLQNLIPNCTLDDKQPVEKLFRSGNVNTAIHSLVEWKLDASDVRSGYKYMTTGFCARKAREAAEEGEKNSDTANIEYFNYCIFYREAGENDIRNLPLVNGKERVTYNGLKTYLRELEKRDFGVEVHIFDRKGDYQNFISNYGLFESQWEIVRGINKTEGHVRTYFENNYKTTRKVVEDLLIEEIIEKSYNNRIRKDSSDDEEMARTLLDIKDQLAELAKRKSEIQGYDVQKELLEEFAGNLERFRSLFSEKEQASAELVQYLQACRAILARKEREAQTLLAETASLEEAASKEEQMVAAAEMEGEYRQLEKLEQLIHETSEKREAHVSEQTRLRQSLAFSETAADYEDYLEYKKQQDELVELMNSRSMNKGELASEMKRLAATRFRLNEPVIAQLRERIGTSAQKLPDLKQSVEKQNQLHMDAFGAVRSCEGLAKELEEEISVLKQELESLLAGSGLLVAEHAYEQQKITGEKESQARKNQLELEAQYKDCDQGYYQCKQAVSSAETRLTYLEEELQRQGHVLARREEAAVLMESLKKIYGEVLPEALIGAIEHMYEKITRDTVIRRTEAERLASYKDAVKNGKIPEYENSFLVVNEYLQGRYKDDIRTGREILGAMDPQEAAEALELFPMLPYVIFAKESYQDMAHDKALKTLNTGSSVIPILKWEVFENGNYPYTGEEWIPVYKDMSFLWDEVSRNGETGKCEEDLARLTEEVRRLEDRRKIMEKDLLCAREYMESEKPEDIRRDMERVRTEIRTTTADKDKAVEEIQRICGKRDRIEASLVDEKAEIENLRKRTAFFEKIVNCNESINNRFARLKANEAELGTGRKAYSNSQLKLRGLEAEFHELQNRLRQDETRLAALEGDFANLYSQYYDSGVEGYEGMSAEETDAKAGAIRKLLSEEFGDLADKEKLLATYRASMEKCLQNIRYRGMTLELAAQQYEAGLLVRAGMEELMELKRQLDKIGHEIHVLDSGLDSERAQQNRMEGGISHAKGLYNERFGAFTRMDIQDTVSFISAHKQELVRIKELLGDKQKELKVLEHSSRDTELMEKDLERIVRNAGMEVPELLKEEASDMQPVSIEAYESAQKKYEKLLKEEARRKDEFQNDRQKLADALGRCNAFELAEEIRESLKTPEMISDVDRLQEGLHETCDCIVLERDSIERGIQDMESIRDSFENRCIQICSNIRTELDRLPKLSRITLDEDVISIITLVIPYIREELYHDRMNVYINETVAVAETYQGQEEKLKYIRTRLSWKKLFSVIVTDMNSIRLSLYKREHMKDQSRYLKYEEAVGSTGQSQGIYIQFLIAIINYISSLNATGRDGSVIGKTIFIDNPFGAAKDVYIWEPIFKLLKTNHVQLIVPARGATPAISKMFDVNYILGQKMVEGRTQTVVTDYRSQVQMDELEYDNLEYEQTSLNLD